MKKRKKKIETSCGECNYCLSSGHVITYGVFIRLSGTMKFSDRMLFVCPSCKSYLRGVFKYAQLFNNMLIVDKFIIIDTTYSVSESNIYISLIRVNKPYRRLGLFKRYLNILQIKYNKDIVLEAFNTLVPMYKHLGFKEEETSEDGYTAMVRTKDYIKLF